MSRVSDLLQRSWAPILLLSLSACAGIDRQLMPAPNLYTAPGSPPLFKDLPEQLENSNIDLLYVTDREPQADTDEGLNYGYGRSRSVAFGSAVVAIRPHMDWNDLERVSIERDRSTRLTLEMTSIEERGRFAETPGEVVRVDGQSRYATDYLETNRKAKEAFRREIVQRLALAPKDEVLIFIHGFNNDFDDAAYTLAELWHYMGRQHVPILYTWPAGRGGPSGYIYDRESGEFTVYHLKNLIRTLSDIPEIKSFHMIGHSRGTDVLSSAVRELTLEARAAGADVPDEVQGSHIILAAPDLDMDVVSQRIVAEQLGRETKNITIYTSQSDKAIGLAEWFFKSPARMGRLGAEDLSETDLSSLKNIEGISLVELQETKGGGSGHGYFHSDPAASSDLILMVRYGKEPGEANGRPLKPVATGFWEIEPGYPTFKSSKD